MTKKQNTMYVIIGLILGIVGGIAGTSFSMGAERQRVSDLLDQHTSQIIKLDKVDKENARNNKEETDRLDRMLINQMDKLQLRIKELTSTVSNLRTDVQVIKAVMERMESGLKMLNKD